MGNKVTNELQKIDQMFEAEGQHALLLKVNAQIRGRPAKGLTRVFAIANLAGIPHEQMLEIIITTGLINLEERFRIHETSIEHFLSPDLLKDLNIDLTEDKTDRLVKYKAMYHNLCMVKETLEEEI